MATEKYSSSSSSSASAKGDYEVFISFRGEDTRKTFTDHLYAALRRKGINTFKDDEKLRRGEEISAGLINAIEESRISIVVLSSDYASSTWCLDELVKILECKEMWGQTVLPVFYNVDPSDVRKQTGSFEQAFAKHEETFEGNIEKVEMWREALRKVADLCGSNLSNEADGCEAKFIQKIVQDIWRKLDLNILGVAKYPVGINSRVEEIKLSLGVGESDVRFIGICGIGGIGKTEIAKALYNQIAKQFDGYSFLANVREASKKHDGLVELQRQLLFDILDLEKADLNISNDHRGAKVIKERLCCKRVLLVLDDVDRGSQLDKLIGRHDWFGSGSRIIITTRDEHLLLAVHGKIHKVEKLNYDEGLQLFSWNAFGKDHPEDDFYTLSHRVANYADGHPLALIVLGSFLFGKTEDEWEKALKRLKITQDDEIHKILRVSFDGLGKMEKKIFLDVACFFKGRNEKYVREVLESCGFYPDVGLRILVERSLIIISDNRISMHDLLQQMGQEIVNRESPQAGKRSRLWLQEDICHVLNENTGTEEVEGIVLDYSAPDDVPFSNDAFARMKELRLLKVCNVYLSESLEYFFKKEEDFNLEEFERMNKVIELRDPERYRHHELSTPFDPEKFAKMNDNIRLLRDCNMHPSEVTYLSNKLRCLNWHGYPSKSMPSSFHPRKLIELDMRYSRIERLWKTKIKLENLKYLNLSHCQYLTTTPDFSGFPSLEILILEGCTRLVEVQPSNLFLDKLVSLIMKDCNRLGCFWRSIKLASLKNLILSGCSRLAGLPQNLENMKHLRELLLDGTAVKELPSSINHLQRLVSLNLENCKNLASLGCSICELKSLETLRLSGCSKVDELPENLGNMEKLVDLSLDRTAIRQLPSSLGHLTNLQRLSLRGCKGSFSLKSILWASLLQGNIRWSRSLLVPSLTGLFSLTTLNLSDCDLSEGAIPRDICSLSSLCHLDLSKNNFISLTPDLSRLTRLETLKLAHCLRVQELPPFSSSIHEIDAHDCRSLEKLPQPSFINHLTLRNFIFTNCEKLAGHEGNLFFQRGRQADLVTDRFDIFLPGSEILEGFDYQSMGSSVSFKLSPTKRRRLDDWDFCRAQVAFCAVFAAKGAVGGYVHCVLRVGNNTTYSGRMEFSGKRAIESDHVWLLYDPRNIHWGKTRSDGYCHFEASFDIYDYQKKKGHPNELEVKRCGVHVFYEFPQED